MLISSTIIPGADIDGGRYLSDAPFPTQANEILDHIKRLEDSESDDAESNDEEDEQDVELKRQRIKSQLMRFFETAQVRSEGLKPLLNDMPFLEYAGSNWCTHVNLAQGQTALEDYPWILDKTSPRLRTWLLLNSWEGGPILDATDLNCQASFVLPRLLVTYGPASQAFHDLELIHVVAYMGLHNLCFQILELQPNATLFALLIAAYKAHDNIVRDILQDPGNVKNAMPAFLSISFTKNTSTARLLLDAEEKVAGRNNAASCALLLLIGACLSGTVAMAQLAVGFCQNLPVLEFSMISIIENLRKRVETTNSSLPLDELDRMATSEDVTTWSPFMLATVAGHDDMINFTFEHNLFAIARVSEIELMVTFMCFTGHTSTLRTLLELPERINTSNALCAACFTDSHDIINILLDDGRTLPNLLPGGGGRLQTPIGLAASLGSVATAVLFMDKGASYSSTDTLGMTPLHWAVDGGHQDMVQWLVSIMSSDEVIREDDKGRTALDIAYEGGHLELIQLLQDLDVRSG
jgi:ankyrin repeat protein